MPDYASIRGDAKCWNCGRCIAEYVDIQWGKLPSQYQLDDTIRWTQHRGTTLEPFVLLRGRVNWNFGDPSVVDLIALDCHLFAAVDNHVIPCESCQADIAGIAVGIHQGMITRIETHSLASMKRLLRKDYGRAAIIVIQPDGVLVPRPDWFDATVHYRDN